MVKLLPLSRFPIKCIFTLGLIIFHIENVSSLNCPRLLQIESCIVTTRWYNAFYQNFK